MKTNKKSNTTKKSNKSKKSYSQRILDITYSAGTFNLEVARKRFKNLAREKTPEQFNGTIMRETRRMEQNGKLVRISRGNYILSDESFDLYNK